ncbi:MAG: hypothetical protein ABW321_29775 [Polyangiales bacterium]
MPQANRAFLSQDRVDQWLAEGCIQLEGEVLSLLPDGPAFRLESAVYFRSEVTGSEDAYGLCGTVKSLHAITALSGEHVPGSVVVGDNAYEVLDGFLGELVPGLVTTVTDGERALAALMRLHQGGSPDTPSARAQSNQPKKARNSRGARAGSSRS